jgi:hypothetical protein
MRAWDAGGAIHLKAPLGRGFFFLSTLKVCYISDTGR